MKKYFLFVVGEFSDLSKICYIVDSIAEVTTSPYVKFNFVDKRTLVLHFGTNISFDRLKNLADIATDKSANSNFLLEYTDNMSVSFLQPSVLESFLDLTTCSKTSDLNNYLHQKVQEYSNEIETTKVETKIKEEVIIREELSVDGILDKINEKGIKSLTNEEREFLKNVN
jgi:hypothetical protein